MKMMVSVTQPGSAALSDIPSTGLCPAPASSKLKDGHKLVMIHLTVSTFFF